MSKEAQSHELTYDLIKRAVHGDQQAIEAYLLHYDAYINSLVMYDEVGPDSQIHSYIDEDKVWHSNSKYKRTVWQCNAKFKGEHKCTTPHLYEQRIQELFLEALSSLMENRDSLIDDCRAVMHVLGDCKAIDREMEEVRSEMEVTTGLIQKLIDENATRKMDQNDYRKRYDGYVSRYAALESRMDSLEKERKEREFKYDIFSGFLFELGEIHELPLAFDDRLFYQLIDYATVYSDGRVVFTFRNGTEITTEM